MNSETHSQIANFIWDICNLLRGPYKRNEYRKVILPLTVLRRFDCLLEPTKQAVLDQFKTIKTKPETVIRSLLQKSSGYPFYNLSRLDFPRLLDDPNQLAQNLNSYINAFSPNVLTNRKERERRGKVQLIDARRFFIKMKKSLGNKRNKIGDKDEGEPDQIGDITRILGNAQYDETRTFQIDGQEQGTDC